MALLSGLLFAFFGVALLIVSFRGLRDGELRAGPNWFSGVYQPNRADTPLTFYFFALLYICSGTALLFWGLAILAGYTPPPPLH